MEGSPYCFSRRICRAMVSKSACRNSLGSWWDMRIKLYMLTMVVFLSAMACLPVWLGPMRNLPFCFALSVPDCAQAVNRLPAQGREVSRRPRGRLLDNKKQKSEPSQSEKFGFLLFW